MTIRSAATLAVVATAVMGVSACSTLKSSVGIDKVVPDEFVTVATAPLSLPPEYGLTPPSPGQPRPQELAPDSAARQILLGQRQAITRTPGEQALSTMAGGDRADPIARYVIDDEFGDLAHKDESWARRIMFWRKNDPESQAPSLLRSADGTTTIDASTEHGRLQALTGGREGITIAPRQDSRGFKLPGL